MSRKLSSTTLVGLEELSTPLAGPDAEGEVTRVTPVDEQLVVGLPLGSIIPNPHQPRRVFSPEALQELATSIAEHGRVLQPILVRPAGGSPGSGPAFELVAGERRWRASELAGLPTIRAIVDGVDDATSAEMALAENMARDDLSPVEEARGCAALRDRFGMSVTDIARRVGRDRSAVSHLIRLLDLPDEALELIGAGALSEGHGRVLLRLPEPDTQRDVAAACAESRWSVRELERRVDNVEAEPAQKPVSPHAPETQMADQADLLRAALGREVTIVPRRRGTFEIRVLCGTLEELEHTVDRLQDALLAGDAAPQSAPQRH